MSSYSRPIEGYYRDTQLLEKNYPKRSNTLTLMIDDREAVTCLGITTQQLEHANSGLDLDSGRRWDAINGRFAKLYDVKILYALYIEIQRGNIILPVGSRIHDDPKQYYKGKSVTPAS